MDLIFGLGFFFFLAVLFYGAPCLTETLVKFHKVMLLSSFCPFLGNHLSYPTCEKPCGGWVTPFVLKSGLLNLAYSSLSINCMLIQVVMSSSTQPPAPGYTPAILHMAVQWV